MESLPELVRNAPTAVVDGEWQRHVPARHAASALDGRRSASRWGTVNGFSILHLGRPRDSVIVEAYRHLVDAVDNPRILDELRPRMLVTCMVQVTEILDLRAASARVATGLDFVTLRSDPDDRDAHLRCQEVAAVAHQLGLHGLVAPAATGLGDTLALFPERLPDIERPQLSGDEIWMRLPPDPRTQRKPSLRIIEDSQ